MRRKRFQRLGGPRGRDPESAPSQARKVDGLQIATTAQVDDAVGVDTVRATARMRGLTAAMSNQLDKRARHAERDPNEERLDTLLRRRELCARTVDALADHDADARSLRATSARALLQDIDAEVRDLARTSRRAGNAA